ncbi:MAG: oxidoreductase, partial [Bacteroidetes bacterium QH_6_64_77]
GLEDGHEQMEMMAPEDIADTIHYALTAPEHVDVEELLVMPTEQQG